jgi:hypothetical protein
MNNKQLHKKKAAPREAVQKPELGAIGWKLYLKPVYIQGKFNFFLGLWTREHALRKRSGFTLRKPLLFWFVNAVRSGAM